MQYLSAQRVGIICVCLLALSGCIAPQQAVRLSFVDAQTNLPLRQVKITQRKSSRSSVLPDVPVFGYAGRKAGPAEITHHVADEQWQATLPGDSQVVLSKEGYQPVHVEPKPFGIRVENTGTDQVHDELLLEPTTVIKFSRIPETAVTGSNYESSE